MLIPIREWIVLLFSFFFSFTFSISQTVDRDTEKGGRVSVEVVVPEDLHTNLHFILSGKKGNKANFHSFFNANSQGSK